MEDSGTGKKHKKKAPFKYKLREAGVTFRSLTPSQMISMVILLALLVAVPVGMVTIMNPKAIIRSSASSGDIGDILFKTEPESEMNQNPVIVNDDLKEANVGKNYSVKIEGYDSDINDGLSMNVKYLPAGFSQGACRSSKNRKDSMRELSCIVEGIPRIPGEFILEVVLTDDKGGSVSKFLDLQVN